MLYCVVTGGRPEPTITWKVPNDIPNTIHKIINTSSDGGKIVRTSTIELLPKLKDNSTIITCEAEHSTLLEPMNASLLLFHGMYLRS